MRAIYPRCAAAAVICAFAGLPALSALAENRSSESSIRIVTPANAPVERIVPEKPALNTPEQALHEENSSVVEQAAYEEVEEAPPAALPASNAYHEEVVEAPLPAVRRLPMFPGRPPAVQVPRRMTIQPAPQRSARRVAKPFSEYQPDPTISPYLNMYRDENEDEGVPNYFAFVRPVFEQQEVNRAQQQELVQLRGQVQNMSSGASPVRATGPRSRYMDTAQFYGGRTR